MPKSTQEWLLGLEPIFKNRKHVFLKVANGYQCHPQVVALFDSRYEGEATPDTTRTILHHIAFSISKGDFKSERAKAEESGRQG